MAPGRMGWCFSYWCWGSLKSTKGESGSLQSLRLVLTRESLLGAMSLIRQPVALLRDTGLVVCGTDITIDPFSPTPSHVPVRVRREAEAATETAERADREAGDWLPLNRKIDR